MLSLILSVSCIEIIPDLSPNTPQGDAMVVLDINAKLSFDEKQGQLDRTPKYDINGDGVEDVWFVKSNVYHSFNFTSASDIQSVFVAINGEILVKSEEPFYAFNQAYPLDEYQLVGENIINGAKWIKNGYRFGSKLDDITTADILKYYTTPNYTFCNVYEYRCSEPIFSDFPPPNNCSILPSDNLNFQGPAHYIAFKFKINNKLHYGWMSFDRDELLQVAYSTKPNQRVITGQVK